MKLEIYKDHYQFEWDHRSHLTSALNVPIAAATLVGGALTVMAQQFPYGHDYTTYLFGALGIAAACSIFFAVYFLFSALHGYEYQRIPTPATLKKYYDDLLNWHEQYGTGKDTAENEFVEYFCKRMAEATEINANNNKRKSAFIYNTNFILAISLLLTAFTAVPYLVKATTSGEKVYSIRIVEKSATTTEGKKMQGDDQNQTPKTTDQTPTYVPPKPTPPPNENIKEHKVPPALDKLIQERKE